jgi:hypothetical protein
VYARKYAGNAAKKEVHIYQALEFKKGADMPEECMAGLSEKQREDLWVLGVYYAPASVIRRANEGLKRTGLYFRKTIAKTGSLARSTRRLSGSAPSW